MTASEQVALTTALTEGVKAALTSVTAQPVCVKASYEWKTSDSSPAEELVPVIDIQWEPEYDEDEEDESQVVQVGFWNNIGAAVMEHPYYVFLIAIIVCYAAVQIVALCTVHHVVAVNF